MNATAMHMNTTGTIPAAMK
uniref:Uncharacterized protein n=1 Tax=Arundo donax TaxID=35708 RepID=A0A0A8YXH3_ARUDO